MASATLPTRTEQLRTLQCSFDYEIIADSTAAIFDITRPILGVTVATAECSGCGIVYHYDGRNDRIININDKYFFTERLLRQTIEDVFYNGASFYSKWLLRLREYKRVGIPYERLRSWRWLRDHFQMAAIGWWELCDDTGIKSCECNGKSGVVLDGIVLSIKRDYLASLNRPWVASDDEPPAAETVPFNRRIFLPRKAIREKLAAMCQSWKGWKNPAGLTNTAYRALFNDGEFPPILLPLFEFFPCQYSEVGDDNRREHRWFIDIRIRQFITAIAASVSPVCALIRPQVMFIVEKLAGGSSLTIQERIKLSQFAPVFANLYTVVYNLYSCWPSQLVPLTRSLLHLAVLPYSSPHQNDSYNVPEQHPLDSFASTGQYYPTLPVLRKLKNYRRCAKSKDVCSKYPNIGGKLAPGITVVYYIMVFSRWMRTSIPQWIRVRPGDRVRLMLCK